MMSIQNISNFQFRANPAYQLVLYDQLAPEEQAQLQTLAEDANFYGVLVKGTEVKAVDQETALLLLTLSAPGVIPTYVHRRFGEGTNQAIAQLVLDNLLQMEIGDQYVSGSTAHIYIYGEENQGTTTAAHRLTQLSYKALRYGQALPAATHDQLSQRLYFYNTIPLSVKWQRQLPSETAVRHWLGVDDGLGTAWQSLADEDLPGWLSWQHRQAKRQTLPYKLYVSPHPDSLDGVFQLIVATLGRHKVPTFKVGKDVQGILRSDKLVAYLPDFESLAAVAQTLQAELAGCPTQGVPFTAPIDSDGLLSWGMDPPAEAQIFSGSLRESWRLWVCQQLAAALIAAHRDEPTIAPWQFALDRLKLAGVDTTCWLPEQSIWQKQSA